MPADFLDTSALAKHYHPEVGSAEIDRLWNIPTHKLFVSRLAVLEMASVFAGKVRAREELDAESDQYNADFSATRAKRVANSKPHPKKLGRPAKPADQKAARILITMTPTLLAATDAAAGRRGLTRAGLIHQALLDWLARQPRQRKSA